MSPYRTPGERPDYTTPAPRRRRRLRLRAEYIPIALAVIMAAIPVACQPPQTAAQAAAEGAYGAALLDCVDRATTLAESKACRARVDAAWGVTQTGRDGGR